MHTTQQGIKTSLTNSEPLSLALTERWTRCKLECCPAGIPKVTSEVCIENYLSFMIFYLTKIFWFFGLSCPVSSIAQLHIYYFWTRLRILMSVQASRNLLGRKLSNAQLIMSSETYAFIDNVQRFSWTFLLITRFSSNNYCSVIRSCNLELLLF